MTTLSFGGSITATSNTSYPGTYVSHDGIGMPTGNLCFNGLRPIYITPGSPNVLSASGSGLSVYVVYQGSGSAGIFSTSGGTFEIRIAYNAGTLYFGRNGAGSGVVYDAGDGTTWAGEIPGSIDYLIAPTIPLTVSATPLTGTSVKIDWTAPASNGGTAITGYRVRRTDSDGISNPVNFDVGVVLTYTDTTAAPGSTYVYTVHAKNAVTTAAGTVSASSSGISVTTGSAIRYDDGSSIITPVWYYDTGAALVPVVWYYDTGAALVSLQ